MKDMSSKKISAWAAVEGKQMVRMVLGGDDPILLRVWSEGGHTRAIAHLTNRQAIARAYKLLHAANAGQIDADVSPPSELEEAS